MLALPVTTLSTYISAGKVPMPRSVTSGRMTIYLWTEEDVERVRQLLPKIKNGRKTRYKKKQSAFGNQQSATTQPKATAKPKTKKQPPPRATVPHKQLRNKQSKHPASTNSQAKHSARTSSRAK
jgi:hypothetical protein